MNNKILIRIVLKNVIFVAVVLLLLNLICLIPLRGQEDIFYNYIFNANSSDIVFLSHMPLMLVFIIKSLSVVQRPYIIVRHRSFEHLYVTNIKLAFVAAFSYFVIKIFIEVGFILCLNINEFFQIMSSDCLFVYLVQFLAIFFAFLLFIVLFEIFRKISTASVGFFLIIGVDLLSSILPVFGNKFFDLNFLIMPMTLVSQYVSSYLYNIDIGINTSIELLNMLVKICIVGVVPLLTNAIKRRSKYVQS